MAEPVSRHALQPPFLHRAGLAWAAHLPEEAGWPSDGSDDKRRSQLRLWENDTRLGPRHAIHDAIENEGAGRYSHWNGGLIFSTGDGSDPNTNGRRYAVSLGAPTTRVVGLGSCHLHDALIELEDKALVHWAWRTPALAHTPREAAQLLGFHLGELDIPAPLHSVTVADTALAGSDPADFRPGPARIKQADIAFLEFGSTVDIAYGPFWLLRAPLRTRFIDKFAALGAASRQTAYRWYNQGLLKRNEAVRAECAARMLDMIPRLGVDRALARDVVCNARGAEQDMASVVETMRGIRDTLQAKATCVLSSQNAFMPDGRPLSWPGNFFKVIETACGEIGLPLLHTKSLVAEQGAAFAIKKDLVHFTPQMITLLGTEILAMGNRALRALEPDVVASHGGSGARTPAPAES